MRNDVDATGGKVAWRGVKPEKNRGSEAWVRGGRGGLRVFASAASEGGSLATGNGGLLWRTRSTPSAHSRLRAKSTPPPRKATPGTNQPRIHKSCTAVAIFVSATGLKQ